MDRIRQDSAGFQNQRAWFWGALNQSESVDLGWKGPLGLRKYVFPRFWGREKKVGWEWPGSEDPFGQISTVVFLDPRKPLPRGFGSNDGTVAALCEATGFNDADAILLTGLKDFFTKVRADFC
ncbi:hypothetical protein CBD41_01450 [bacterium TMED181]|nr:hypothetical protein [Planctomycetota bacterium]OUW47128.1 MAG: hypothetical protein CBD41_01450 [bacterium TMED181]